MYRCSICEAVSPPGRPRMVHAITRTVRDVDQAGRKRDRVETATEIGVCPRCQTLLDQGRSIADVRRLTAEEREARREERGRKPDPEPGRTRSAASDRREPEREPAPVPRTVKPEPGPLVVGRRVVARKPQEPNGEAK